MTSDDRTQRMLKEHIDAYYRASAMHQGSPAAIVASFMTYQERYPELKDAAAKALAETPSEQAVHPQRCFVTQKRRDFLRQVVGAPQGNAT